MTRLDNIYHEHFGLNKQPFQLAPDPKFLYLSKAHRRAKAYMEYTVINRDSFVVITGEIGSGKTTLIHDLLANIKSDAIVAKIHQTQLDELEFYQAILIQFGLKPSQANKVELLNMLNNFLMEKANQGQQVILIIDEAQNLSTRVLEEVRLMTGLETDKGKIFNLILVGQPELREAIDAPGMEQLSQRIRFRFHLKALTGNETREYINHRLNVAGVADGNLFSRNTYSIIHRYTGGLPRLINILCDTALLSALVDGKYKITVKIIENVISELQWSPYCDRKNKKLNREDQNYLDQEPPRVLIKRNNREGQEEFKLDKESITLGRYKGNDIKFNTKTINGHHAKIINLKGKFYIIDLDSKYGTYINNKRVNRGRLKNNDVITLSPKKYLLEDGKTISVASATLNFIEEVMPVSTSKVTSIALNK